MNGKRDYYEVLGIPRTAGSDEVKQAYRNLAREVHPDVAKDKAEAERKFKEINEAFAVLSNPEKRERYDRYGHAGIDMSGMGEGFGFNFSAGFDVFDDILGSFFGDSRRGQNAVERGDDFRYDLELTLEESYTGGSREISVKAPTPCSHCEGTGAERGGTVTCETCRGAGRIREIAQSLFGRVVRTRACPQCQGQGQILKVPCKSCLGSGVVEVRRKLTVKIPAGVDDETRIRLSGEGGAGFRGAPAGDLYVFVHLKPNPNFIRNGDDILYEAAISFPEAVLGAQIEVPTLGGKEQIHIPAGTQNGATFRLRGKGMPSVNGFSRGDQIVTIRVQVPKKLNEKQKELLRQLAQSLGINLTEKGLLGRVRDALG